MALGERQRRGAAAAGSAGSRASAASGARRTSAGLDASADLRRLEQRARFALASYRLEAQSCGGEDVVRHGASLVRLERVIKSCSREIDLHGFDARAGAHAAAGLASHRIYQGFAPDALTAQEAAGAAKACQHASFEAVSRMQAMVRQAEDTAVTTLETMAEQEEQLKRVGAAVDVSKRNMSRSRVLIRQLKGGVRSWFRGACVGHRPHSQTCAPDPEDEDVSTLDGVDEFRSERLEAGRLLDDICQKILQRRALFEQPGCAASAPAMDLAIRVRFDSLDDSMLHLQTLLRTQGSAWRSGDAQQQCGQTRYQELRALRQRRAGALGCFEALAGEQRASGCRSRSASPRQRQRAPEQASAVSSKVMLPGPRSNGLERPSHFIDGHGAYAKQLPGGASTAAVGAHEQAFLLQLRQRDAALDGELDKIGGAVRRLSDMAGQMSIATQRQRANAELIIRDVDDTASDLVSMNRSMRQQLRR